MNQHFWNKRIPTFLGVILIAIGLGVTTFLVKQGGLFSINANPTTQPENVRITNVSDNSFTVSYETNDVNLGAVSYGETTNLGQSGLDDRDQNSGTVTPHKMHNITIRNLNPETKYFFSIISGKDTYLNNSSPYEVTTGKQIANQPSSQEPVSGKIVLTDGKPPTESIIYITTDNAQVISTLVKDDGTFILPLNNLRTSDLSDYFTFVDETVLKLLVLGDGQTSNAIISILQAKPIPTITLSNDYDFTNPQSPVASSSAQSVSFPSFGSSEQQSSKGVSPEILTPQKDQNFTDNQPEFKGKAPANQTIQIIIHSDEGIQTTVKADSNGNWTYRPDTNLSAGQHTITIIAKDASGVSKTITQSFVVFASGSQIAGENGSPTPTSQPTFTPTALPTTNLTTSPTEIVPTENSTTSVTTTTTITPSPPLPPTGNPTIIAFGIAGLILTVLGGLLFLF